MSSDIVPLKKTTAKHLGKTDGTVLELDLHEMDYKDSYRAKKLLSWIEQYWMVHSSVPSLDVAVSAGVDSELFETWISSKPFRQALKYRGVGITSGYEEETVEFSTLTDLQMLAVELITDLTDNRSIKVKLAEISVESKTWVRWLADPVFAQYINAKTKNQLVAHEHEANLAVMDGVRAGDTGILKMYYELIGRTGTKSGLSSLDPGWIIQNMVEIIQEESKLLMQHDPDYMKRVGNRLMGLITRTMAEQAANKS